MLDSGIWVFALMSEFYLSKGHRVGCYKKLPRSTLEKDGIEAFASVLSILQSDLRRSSRWSRNLKLSATSFTTATLTSWLHSESIWGISNQRSYINPRSRSDAVHARVFIIILRDFQTLVLTLRSTILHERYISAFSKYIRRMIKWL